MGFLKNKKWADRGDLDRGLRLLGAFVATSMVGGVLATGLLLPITSASGQVAKDAAEFYKELPSELDMRPMSQKTRILYSDGTPMASVYYENRIAVPLSSVAPIMRQAVIDIEDYRFYEHTGADFTGILRAALKSLGGAKEGASTLTQQWIKNVLLDKAQNEELDIAKREEQIHALQSANKARKVKEIKLALAAEKRYKKDEILQNYLNIALFGPGAFGVESASRQYFNKSASELTLVDAALLAGALKSPTAYDPVQHPEKAKDRRNTVLHRMRELGHVSEADYQKAIATPVPTQLNVSKAQNGCEQAAGAGFACDYVLKSFLNDAPIGKDKDERSRILYRGGLTITTTIDRVAQQAATEEVVHSVDPANSTPGIGASIVSVQPGTGQIKAMAQNMAYHPRDNAAPGTTSLNFNVRQKYAGTAGWQSGSNYKAFILAEWVRSGKSPNQSVNAGESTYNDRQFSDRCSPNGHYGSNQNWSPKNAGGASGSMTVAQGTKQSVNNVFASMETQLDLCDIVDTAKALGLSPASLEYTKAVDVGDKATAEAYERKHWRIPANVLGTLGVAPVDVAGAYATFGAGGVHCNPHIIASVIDANGLMLPAPDGNCKQALESDVAWTVTDVLTGIFQGGGTVRNPNMDRPAAGKTGTTNDAVATWFTGFTPSLATSVWVGYVSGNKSLNGGTFSGDRNGNMFGSTVSYPTWEAYMKRALQGVPEEGFGSPSKWVAQQKGIAIPDVAGQPTDQAIAALKTAGFAVNTAPGQQSDKPAGTALGSVPRAGGFAPAGSTVTVYPSGGNTPPQQSKPGEQPQGAPHPGHRSGPGELQSLVSDRPQRHGGL